MIFLCFGGQFLLNVVKTVSDFSAISFNFSSQKIAGRKKPIFLFSKFANIVVRKQPVTTAKVREAKTNQIVYAQVRERSLRSQKRHEHVKLV